MRKALQIISFLGLAILLISPVLEVVGQLSTAANKLGIAIGTILWFATAPFWMNKAKTK